MKNLSENKCESGCIKKERPGRNFILFLLGLFCFTFVLGGGAHLYDSKYPKVFPAGIAVSPEDYNIKNPVVNPIRLVLGGFPGPVIDVHVERPLELPKPGGLGPDGNIA